MIMLTRSSKRIFNPMRYTGNENIHLCVICLAVCNSTSLENAPKLIPPEVLDNTIGATIEYACEPGFTMKLFYDNLECKNKTVPIENCKEQLSAENKLLYDEWECENETMAAENCTEFIVENCKEVKEVCKWHERVSCNRKRGLLKT